MTTETPLPTPAPELPVRPFVDVLVDLLVDSAAQLPPAALVRHAGALRWAGTHAHRAGTTAAYREALAARMRREVGRRCDPELELTLASGLVLDTDLRTALAHLPLKWYPDMLWHVPGVLVNSLLIEVRDVRRSAADLRLDLERLTWFIGSGHRYGGAVLLLVGPLSPSRRSQQVLQRAVDAGVVVLRHTTAGHRPVRL